MRWRHGGRRKFKAFASEIDRWRAAESMNAKREEHGRSVLTFDPAGWREYQDAKAIVGAADLRVICREWADRNGHRLRHVGILTSDAIEKYLKLRHAEDVRERTDTYRQLDMHLARRFSAAFGKERLADITADQIRAWLAALKDPDTGEPMAPVTLRNHRKNVLVFFKRAVEEGWIGTNVAAKVKPIQVDEEDGVVMPPEHVRALFEANRNEPVVGRLALEAFGGLRASSAGRIQREHLDFDAQGITMPGRVHKSGRRKYRQGHPDVLWEWLRAAPASCWTDITPAAY
ncbi:MAG TPA: hypothetical protein VFE31_10450, partial [Opitutaceae bacterium]|nr:hypothetical protein [Opitutaceae bacterium]